jgi:hypothetical protein
LRDAEWISGNRANIAQWNYGTTGNVAYHQVYRQTQQAFSEVADQTEYGNWYWATNTGNGFSYQAGPDTVVRGQFESNGVLANSYDSNYRAIQTNWPVFAFTFDLGTVGTSDVSLLFSIGLCQQEAIQFDGATGVKSLPSLWTSYFQDDLAAVCMKWSDLMPHVNVFRSNFSKTIIRRLASCPVSWTTK